MHTQSWDIPIEIETKIIEAQKDFFENENDLSFCNPVAYKHLIPKAIESKTQMQSKTRDAAIRLVERILAADKEARARLDELDSISH